MAFLSPFLFTCLPLSLPAQLDYLPASLWASIYDRPMTLPIITKVPGFSSFLTESSRQSCPSIYLRRTVDQLAIAQWFLLGRCSLFWDLMLAGFTSERREWSYSVWGRKRTLWTAEELWRTESKGPWNSGMLYSTWWDTPLEQWNY